MKKVIVGLYSLFVTVCMTTMLLVMIACIMTPHKTSAGLFTDPWKYWTSDAYICDNFNDAVCVKGVLQ